VTLENYQILKVPKMAYISWDSLKNPVADNSFKLSATHFENVGLRRTLDRKKKYPLSQGHFYFFIFLFL